MKKKLLKITGLLVTFIMVMWFAGCGKTPETPDNNTEPEGQTAEAPTEAETPQPTEEPVQEPENTETFVLTQGYQGSLIYVIDSEGKRLKTIDRKAIDDNIRNSDKEKYCLVSDDGYNKATLVAEGDGFLFFQDTVQMDDGSGYEYIVYAVNEDDLQIRPVATVPYNYYIVSTDYYDGAFYLDFSFGYDENSNYLGAGERKFVYDEAGDYFSERDSDYNSVFESAKVMGVRLNGTSRVMGYNQDSFTRTMEECGFILGSTDNGYAMVDKNGAVTPALNFDGQYISMYSKDHMIYVFSDYGTGIYNAFIYDINGKATNQITDDMPMLQAIGRNGNDFYYYTQNEKEYGININRVYKYDAEADQTTLLYEAESAPGVHIMPGVEEFKLFGDKMYAICFDKGETKWMRIDSNDGKATYIDIDCPVDTINVFDYGTITYKSKTSDCPDCGTPLEKIYAECFVLDGKYSKNAEKINAFLRDVMDGEIGEEGDPLDSYWGSPCEEHQENPTWYQITEEYTVGSIKIVQDKYLAVNMGGYWYAGGAHGMPTRSQYFFDLETGEEKNLEDFYTGTDEDFKALVAEKTREDFISRPYSSSPYFAEDAETAYNQAYDYASLEWKNFEFDEDGIWYYYPPYEMGPYASGYIEIFIPYKDLLGRDDL